MPLLHEPLASARSLLEVGYATGEFYRYLSKIRPDIRYTGLDLSDAAYALVRERYRDADFRLGNCVDPAAMPDEKYDIVFSRDVIHHTGDPFVALRNLYRATGSSLVVSLRTRDVGETVVDRDRSYQEVYETRYHYSLLNIDELLAFLTSLEPRPGKIKVLREHLDLDGHFGRVLPKDSVHGDPGFAVSSVRVDIDEHFEGATEIDVVNWHTPKLGLGHRLRRIMAGCLQSATQ